MKIFIKKLLIKLPEIGVLVSHRTPNRANETSSPSGSIVNVDWPEGARVRSLRLLDDALTGSVNETRLFPRFDDPSELWRLVRPFI